MQICPNCAREHDDRDIICVYCGHAGTPADKTLQSPLVSAPAPLAIPPTAVALPDVSMPEPAASAAPDAGRHSKNTARNVLFGAVAIPVVAAVMFITRSAGSDARMNEALVTIPATAAPGRDIVPIGESEVTAAPKWKRTRQSGWATDGSRTMGFELEAEGKVAVYMERVRPILAVRCISRSIEVFVVLHSAASIENDGDTHTVRISLDGEPEVDQQWLDSVDKQALFAPDGKALAARMAASRRLRFSFKPFNAAPATVEFDVHGFDEPLATMSRTCDSGPSRRAVRRD